MEMISDHKLTTIFKKKRGRVSPSPKHSTTLQYFAQLLFLLLSLLLYFFFTNRLSSRDFVQQWVFIISVGLTEKRFFPTRVVWF